MHRHFKNYSIVLAFLTVRSKIEVMVLFQNSLQIKYCHNGFIPEQS